MRYRRTAPIKGLVTGVAAAAGNVGEAFFDQVLVASANALVSTVAENLLSRIVPAGEWVVSGQGVFVPAATTNITQLTAFISLVSATIDAEHRLSQHRQAAAVPGNAAITREIAPSIIRVTVPTEIFLGAVAAFSVSTLSAAGSQLCIRAANAG